MEWRERDASSVSFVFKKSLIFNLAVSLKLSILGGTEEEAEGGAKSDESYCFWSDEPGLGGVGNSSEDVSLNSVQDVIR